MPQTKKARTKKATPKTAKPAKIAKAAKPTKKPQAKAKKSPTADSKKGRRYTDKQRARILAEAAKPNRKVGDVLAKHGVAPATYYQWKRKATEAQAETVPQAA